MKKCNFVLFLAGLVLCFVACQQDLDNFLENPSLKTNGDAISEMQIGYISETEPEFMPLDSVPEWIKEKVSPEEYALWEILSTKYNIDYTFLKWNISTKAKDCIYSCVQDLCSEIQRDVRTEYSGLFLVPSNFREKRENMIIETLSSNGEYDDWHSHSSSATAYSGTYASLYASVSYSSNSKTKEVTNISCSIQAAAHNCTDLSYSGSSNCTHSGSYLEVTCAGTMSYTVNKVKRQPFTVSGRATFPIEY